MKYFLDSAKLDEIQYAYHTFGIDGVQAAEQAPEAAGVPEGQEPPRITKISQLLELLD